MLDLVAVQEVRWKSGGTEPAGKYTYFYRKRNENHELGTGFFVHKGIISAVNSVEFISDRMSYIIPRGRWCHIIVLNIHAPTEDKTGDVKRVKRNIVLRSQIGLQDFDAEVEINSAWETIRDSIKISAKESLGYFEVKHKPWFAEGCSKLLDQRKQSKLQSLQDPSKINGDNLNNVKI
jgi:hypothetical protein